MKDAEKSSTDLPQKMDYVGKPWKVKLQALEASQAHDFQVFFARDYSNFYCFNTAFWQNQQLFLIPSGKLT